MYLLMGYGVITGLTFTFVEISSGLSTITCIGFACFACQIPVFAVRSIVHAYHFSHRGAGSRSSVAIGRRSAFATAGSGLNHTAGVVASGVTACYL